MGELVNGFGGKISGELIRANDWNDMLAKVEELLGDLETSLSTRINVLETRATDLDSRVTALETALAEAEPVIDAVRTRFRRLDLSTVTTRFAIGQRGEIVARVTAVDGSALDLSDASARPWVDFVTVWGTLKASPGFTSRGGAGDQTLSVRVNEDGEARVLLRAAHAEAFAEEEEQEIEGFLTTRPVASSSVTIADFVLNASTPNDADLTPVFQAVSTEYDRVASSPPVFQRYLDTYYLTQPSRAIGSISSVFTQRWRDYRATVMAFLKPDGDPTTADGALASASIQVTFRDWIMPWIFTGYLPAVPTLQLAYANQFRNLVGTDLGISLGQIGTAVDGIVANKGLLGRQRDLLAVGKAIGGLTFNADPPAFMGELVQAVQFGAQVQQTMFYSQAITPGASEGIQGFEATAGTVVKASAEAGRVEKNLSNQIDQRLNEASDALRNEVQVSQVAFQNELLRDDGPIMNVQHELASFSGTLQNLQVTLGNKADTTLIANLLSAQG